MPSMSNDSVPLFRLPAAGSKKGMIADFTACLIPHGRSGPVARGGAVSRLDQGAGGLQPPGWRDPRDSPHPTGDVSRPRLGGCLRLRRWQRLRRPARRSPVQSGDGLGARKRGRPVLVSDCKPVRGDALMLADSKTGPRQVPQRRHPASVLARVRRTDCRTYV